MNHNLWSCNHPHNFWRCQPDPGAQDWQEAIRRALPALELDPCPATIEAALELTLGEGQFGARRWQLDPLRRLYYVLKPLIPRKISYYLRRKHQKRARSKFPLGWPIEKRYVRFQWEVMRQVLIATNQTSLDFIHFWPDGARLCLVLTHDIETGEGQKQAGRLADLEQGLGFRSSFNFVPESYPLDRGLIGALIDRGFEVGIHGLKHDGMLFSSMRRFMKRARKINMYLKEFNAAGFRSPLTHRHPDWMQELEIEYDLSFFDTDPYEPQPGGCMSIWPFTIGRFIELPYTLVQDCTLVNILGASTPQIWLDKVDFLARHFGMALVNIHPDHLDSQTYKNILNRFLNEINCRDDCWKALPREAARWWRARSEAHAGTHDPRVSRGTLVLQQQALEVI